MGFNLAKVLTGAAQGALAGGGPGAIAGGIGGMLSGSDSGIGGGLGLSSAVNQKMYGALAQSASDQADSAVQQVQFDTALRNTHQQFNQMLSKKAEGMHQINSLREVAMQQREADDSITKEYIKSIK